VISSEIHAVVNLLQCTENIMQVFIPELPN